MIEVAIEGGDALHLALLQGDFRSKDIHFRLPHGDIVLHGVFHATAKIPGFRHLGLQLCGKERHENGSYEG